MAKISLHFKSFDVPACIAELQINEKAKSDASHGNPPSTSPVFSSAEIEIVNAVEHFYSDGVSSSAKEKLEESLQNAASLRQSDGHEGQISTLKMNLVTLFADCKEKLKLLHSDYTTDKNRLEFFRKDNNIVNRANLKTTKQKNISILIVLSMFIFEVSVNTSLISGAISGGVFGAVALASVIAFINIVSSFMVGRVLVPNLYHRQKSKVRGAWLGLAVYASLILYINFALGVFRTLSERATQTFSQEQLQRVAAEAAWPFDNLAENTLDSNGLIIIGVLFAVIAVLDGLHFDEIFPGYAKVSREAEASEKKFRELKRECFRLLHSLQQDGNTQITNFKNKREDANKSWAHSIDSVQSAFSDYESWVISLDTAGNNLLQQYRSANKSFRSTDEPKYFQETHDFGFEAKAANRFRSLVSANLSDADKDAQFAACNQIIISEYNAAITELNGIYGELIGNYENFLGTLR